MHSAGLLPILLLLGFLIAPPGLAFAQGQFQNRESYVYQIDDTHVRIDVVENRRLDLWIKAEELLEVGEPYQRSGIWRLLGGADLAPLEGVRATLPTPDVVRNRPENSVIALRSNSQLEVLQAQGILLVEIPRNNEFNTIAAIDPHRLSSERSLSIDWFAVPKVTAVGTERYISAKSIVGNPLSLHPLGSGVLVSIIDRDSSGHTTTHGTGFIYGSHYFHLDDSFRNLNRLKRTGRFIHVDREAQAFTGHLRLSAAVPAPNGRMRPFHVESSEFPKVVVTTRNLEKPTQRLETGSMEIGAGVLAAGIRQFQPAMRAAIDLHVILQKPVQEQLQRRVLDALIAIARMRNPDKTLDGRLELMKTQLEAAGRIAHLAAEYPDALLALRRLAFTGWSPDPVRRLARLQLDFLEPERLPPVLESMALGAIAKASRARSCRTIFQ